MMRNEIFKSILKAIKILSLSTAQLVLFIFAFSVMISHNAKAVSFYDNLIENVASVDTTCIYTGSTSSKIDWTNSWYNFIKNYDASSDSRLQAAKNLLLSNVAKGEGYGVFRGGNIVDGYGFHVIAYDTDEVTPEFRDSGALGDKTDEYTFGFQNAAVIDNFYAIYFVDYGQHGYPCGEITLTADYHMSGMHPTSTYYKHKDDNTLKPLFLVDDIIYPPSYGGNIIKNGFDIDDDEDGLVITQELKQGTSDNAEDTDGDGIDDLKESAWFVDRDETFCSAGVIPKSCAYPDPVKKDLYVEIDWMKDGTHNFKPTNSQLNPIIAAFANKNINLHFDIGQYGGGTEIPYENTIHFDSTQGKSDFYDYVEGTESHDPTLAINRYGIWRYMIMGDHYEDVSNPNSSGIAVVGGSSAFIAYQAIADGNHADHDRAIGGTIMHELGHNLCINNTLVYANEGQDSSCVFSGVDDSVGIPYPSVMNYTYQDKKGLLNEMQDVDYSSGTNVLGDHDDWSAILTGIDDFKRGFTASGKNMLVQANYYSVEKQRPTSSNKSNDSKKAHDGVNNKETNDESSENVSTPMSNDAKKPVSSIESSRNRAQNFQNLYLLPIVGLIICITSGLIWLVLRRKNK